MNNLIQHYFEIILLIYTFALFVLSIVIYLLPKNTVQSALLPNLSLIALFGILHGSYEFIKWDELRYPLEHSALHWVSEGLNIASYFALLEFGRRSCPKKQLILNSIPLFYGFIGCVSFWLIFLEPSSTDEITIMPRLFIGCPGAVMTGFAFLNDAKRQTYPQIKNYLRLIGISFMIYGISILVLPHSDSIFAPFLPDYSSFFAITHIPIHLIRTFLILMIAISITYIVRHLNFYNRQHELTTLNELSQFNELLELRVKKRTAKLKQLVLKLREDIHERKQLEKQREQFFKFFNLAPIFQCIIGLDGYFKQVNPAFTQKLGFSTEELLQIPFIEWVVPEDRACSLAEVQKLQQQELILDFENRYLCQDGSYLWLSWKAFFEPTEQLIYATAYDVTEAKKNAEKLQLADMVYQHSIQAILVTDAKNRIIAANPAFTQITGYSFDEVLGQTPKLFKSGKHDAEFYQSMWDAINHEGQWQGEIWDKCKDGKLHAKFLNINRILNKEGQVHRYLAIFSDITARKQYEEEIKRLSESELNKAKLEAERASQAKNDFLSSMSHELFTPMNAVLGFAQILSYEDLTEEQRENVSTILTGSYQLLDLIKEVLDLSKIESEPLTLTLQAIDLYDLVNNCMALMQPLMDNKNIQVINQLAMDRPLTVMADPLRLKQVLLNLISNAIKYNHSAGSVTLSCEELKSHTVRINVIDTGAGLSEEQLAKLFLPFERLSAKNSAIEGAGLGLCISKKLMAAMQGAIGVESKVDEGCCFWIEIPLV